MLYLTLSGNSSPLKWRDELPFLLTFCYTLQGSVIPAGSRICSIDGKEITDLNCITEILKNHKAGDVVSVTVKCNGKRLQKEITLLDDSQVKKLLLDKNPFISRYSYRWWY